MVSLFGCQCQNTILPDNPVKFKPEQFDGAVSWVIISTTNLIEVKGVKS